MVVFRIVDHNPPEPGDLLSDRAEGEVCPDDDDDVAIACWVGVSTYATETQARNKAKGAHFMGRYIAELHLPDGSLVPWARTGRTKGHHTIWGPPDLLQVCIHATVDV